MEKSSEKLFERIIVPIDGSEKSREAAKKAFSLAQCTNLEVILIHVVVVVHISLRVYIPEISKMLRKKGEEIINEFEEMGSEMNIHIKTKLLEGIPEDEIIKEANENDLIVMGSKGHSTLDRILIGSVSEKVLHHSDATVMIVR